MCGRACGIRRPVPVDRRAHPGMRTRFSSYPRSRRAHAASGAHPFPGAVGHQRIARIRHKRYSAPSPPSAPLPPHRPTSHAWIPSRDGRFAHTGYTGVPTGRRQRATTVTPDRVPCLHVRHRAHPTIRRSSARAAPPPFRPCAALCVRRQHRRPPFLPAPIAR